MNAQTSTLDKSKLRKLKALMDGGKTLDERRAAKRKAEGLAARAGMPLWRELQEAESRPTILRQDTGPTFADIFGRMDDDEERRNPGYKARKAKERAAKEAARLARCDEIARQYGSLDAVFEPTETEAALRDALEPLEDPANGMWGYEGYRGGKITAAMWEAIHGAVELPRTIAAALSLHRAQDALGTDRYTVDENFTPEHWTDAWRSALEHLLDTLADPTPEGVAARIDWMLDLANRDFARGAERDAITLTALKADFAAISAGAQAGQPQTQADRRTAIRDLLRDHPDLPDREIARRAGVSPTTVGNHRRALGVQTEQKENADV